jgi:hypothetical protein
MQMTEENLKLKEIAVQMKAFNVRDNSRKHVSLDEMYKDSVEKLEEQHKKFMDELSQVRFLISHFQRRLRQNINHEYENKR